MGLVEKVIPIVSNATVVTTAIVTNAYVPSNSIAVVVQTGYKFTSNTSSDLFSDVDAFDTSIYRILSMQDDMKTVAIRGVVSDEFEMFLKYAEDLTSGKSVSEGFVSINTYLGSLKEV